TAKVWRGNDDEEVAGKENPERRHGRSERSRDEVPDERRRDDDRAGCDHGDRDRIEKLPLREPLEPLHDPAVEERHDGEPAPEDERAGLCEIPPDSPERVARGWPVQPGGEPDGAESEPRRPQPTRGQARAK